MHPQTLHAGIVLHGVSCPDAGNVTVQVDIECDPKAEEPVAQGAQGQGCKCVTAASRQFLLCISIQLSCLVFSIV